MIERDRLLDAMRRRAVQSLDARGTPGVAVLLDAPPETPYRASLWVLICCMNSRLVVVSVMVTGSSHPLATPLPVEAQLESPSAAVASPIEIELKASTASKGVETVLAGEPVRNLGALTDQLVALHPEPETRGALLVNIYAGDDVQWRHVHDTLATLAAAGFSQVRYGVGADSADAQVK